MIHIQKNVSKNGDIILTVQPESILDFEKCRDMMRTMCRQYCEYGYMTFSQKVQIHNNIPVFIFNVDTETIPMNEDSNGVYKMVEFKDAKPFISISNL